MEGSPRALSSVDDSDEYAEWDAAYVLGSLSEAERGEYEAHLRRCPSCRASVDELSGMPALLGQLTLDDVTSIDPGAAEAAALSPHVLTSLLATVRRRRRNVRLATFAGFAAAAAAVVIAVLVGGQSPLGAPASVHSQAAATELTMSPAAPTELTATFAMVSHKWGTQIDMNCIYSSESRQSGTRAPTRINTPTRWRWSWSAATADTTDWPPGWRSRACVPLPPAARRYRSTKSPRCKSFPQTAETCCCSALSDSRCRWAGSPSVGCGFTSTRADGQAPTLGDA